MRDIHPRSGFWAGLFKSSKRRTTEYLAVILCLILLSSTLTYSWIRRKWAPRIGQENIQIMAGDSLVFSLIGHGFDNSQVLTINDKLGNIILRPVSNLSGKSEDFFALNSNTYNGEFFMHLYPGGAATNEAWTKQGQDYGYIEMSFIIQGKDTAETMESYTKYVFLSTDTDIWIDSTELNDNQKKAQYALRVSLSFDNKTIVFVPSDEGSTQTNQIPRDHYAINNDTVVENGNKIWVADNVPYNADPEDEPGAVVDSSNKRVRKTLFYYDEETEPRELIVQNTNVKLFTDYMGGYKTGTQFDSQQALFSIDPGQQKTITIRIWLEGEDPYCTEQIKGSLINFLMGFESKNIGNQTPVETTVEEETTEEVAD